MNADLNGRNEQSHHFLASERMAKNLPKSENISWESNSRNTTEIVLDNPFSKNTVLVLGDTVRLSHDLAGRGVKCGGQSEKGILRSRKTDHIIGGLEDKSKN